MSEPVVPPWPPDVRELRLGSLAIDLRYRRVTSPGGTVELPHRPFELLCVFLAEPHVLHSRVDLFARVWKGAIVEDANLSQSIWLVRSALGDGARTWLRTVARGGYVFEPPVALEVLSEVRQAAVAAPEETPVELPAAVAPHWRVRAAWVLLPLLLVLIAAALGLRYGATADTGPVRVVLIDLDRREESPSSAPHWSIALLRAWMEWRLSNEPGVVVIDAPRLGRADQAGTVRVVLLSAEAEPADDKHLRLAAHVTVDGTTRSFGGSGALSDVAVRVDALSREVVAALVARPVALDSPPLELDIDTARRYTGALALRSARRPAEAVAAFDDVLAAAPAFGLAHVEQAELLGELGRIGAAREQMQRAAPWIALLPAAAAQVVDAQRYMIQRDFVEAAKAYAALAARYPDQPAYAIDRARALYKSGDLDGALHALQSIDWTQQPPSLQVDALIVRATVALDDNDRERATQDARRADAIAERAGWPWQRGQALFVIARIVMFGGAADVEAVFEDAARQFDIAGDKLGALRVRMYAQARRRESDGTRLHTLLGEARAAGNVELEVFGLRGEALRRGYRGEFAAARALLHEAGNIARAAGDANAGTHLSYELLQADFNLADYAAVDRDLAQMAPATLPGMWRDYLAELTIGVALRRGRFGEADAASARFAAPRDSVPANSVALELSFGCVRAEVALRRGDIAAARLAAGQCARSGNQPGAIAAELVLAHIAGLAGDPAEALRRLDGTRDGLRALADDPNRWGLEALDAQLRLAAGDTEGAERLLADQRARFAAVEMPTLRADVWLTSAESALARDRLDDAGERLAQAQTLLPADDWIADSRARVVAAVLAHRRGQPSALDALRPLIAQARERGDVMLASAASSLLSLPPGAEAAEPAVRSDLRGGSLRWLLGPEVR